MAWLINVDDNCNPTLISPRMLRMLRLRDATTAISYIELVKFYALKFDWVDIEKESNDTHSVNKYK